MNTTNSGTAREVAAGRLSHFEDSDEDFAISPAISLPKRPRRNKPAPEQQPETAADTTPAPQRTPVQRPARRTATTPSAPAAGPSVGVTDDTDESTETSGIADPDVHNMDADVAEDAGVAAAGKGIEDRVRPSNVHIPVDLLPLVEEKCKTGGLSHGELIIIAIEAAHPNLQELIHPGATAGGNLFAPRRSRAARSTDGPLTPLNYRLRRGDFATLDQLVDQFGASSRGHLITAALTHYLRHPQQPPQQ